MTTQLLRESLDPTYDDPQRGERLDTEQLQQMIDDMTNRMAEVNAAQHGMAYDRVMHGTNDPAVLSDNMKAHFVDGMMKKGPMPAGKGLTFLRTPIGQRLVQLMLKRSKTAPTD
jgi:hypothetical protein